MRPSALFALLLSSLCAVVLASGWSKEDHEIFRIRDELELIEGEGVTFYDFVGVKNGPSASFDDINKAYRKTSASLHPDKFKPSKDKRLTRSQINAQRVKASERFARLGLVAKILRGPGRERYDHFLKNGFPKWRGSGYYYARFRPGLGSVLFGIFLVAGGAHYLVLTLNVRKQKEYMANIIKETRQAAFGPSGVPGLPALGEDDESAAKKLAKKAPVRRRVSNGLKSFIVEGNGDVFLIDETEDGPVELLLDVEDIESAKWRNTILVKWPIGLWNLSIGRFIPEKAVVEEEEIEEEIEEIEDETEAPAASVPKKKGVPKKLERVGDGVPRKRKVTRATKPSPK